MTDYITPDDLRAWIGSESTNNATAVQLACTVASREIEQLCERYFWQDSAVRDQDFPVDDQWSCCVLDISTTTGLVVKTDDSYNGTYSTTWTINTDFTLEPRNPSAYGVTVPYTELRATGNRLFPPSVRQQRYPVRITAKYGWSAVPDAVKQATRSAAAWWFQQKDAPDGSIGIDGWGPRFVRDTPAVAKILGPYMKNPIAVA
jgi:hypothetical protein